MTDSGPILVTGAAGQLGAVGRTVCGLLLDRGLPVRAMETAQLMASLGVGGCERCWTCGQQSWHHGGADPGYGPFRERMTVAAGAVCVAG